MSSTRVFGLVISSAIASALAACANPAVQECGATGVFCPEGTHCAAAQGICIQDTQACGNAHVDPGEECDDGNVNDGDGCSHECKIEKCGNGVVDKGEVCDLGPGMNGKCKGCAADCKSFEQPGDFVIDMACGEVCDNGPNPQNLCNG